MVASCRLPLGIPRRILPVFAFSSLTTDSLLFSFSADSDGFGKAGDSAFVAYQAIAFDNHLEDDGVVVAVSGCRDDAQAVAAGFTLHPQLLTAAAPECDEAGFERLGVADWVEEAKHQNLAGRVVLHDARNQAIRLGEIDFWETFSAHWFGTHRCHLWNHVGFRLGRQATTARQAKS